MTRRTKITLAAIGIVLLGLIALLLWWLLRSRPGAGPANVNALPPAPTRLPVTTGTTAGQPRPASIDKPEIDATLKAVASTFAERYGSYSNESGFVNVDDLESLMTPRMSNTAQAFIAGEQTGVQTGYTGVTTRALSVIITAFDPNFGQADATVSTQREESRGSTANPRTRYQNLRLKLVQTGKGWQVDEAVWQ